MATTYRIHPAIGIARVGNSPGDFFVGPERIGERPDPPGGFKDPQCRVKRQAARFRILAHHDDGTFDEITAAEAAITWTVHVANKKAAYPGRGNTEAAGDLTIDPGVRTLSTPNDSAAFDGGTIRFSGQPAVEVPLGEMRTDDEGRLLVLGGHGHSASPAGLGIDNFWASDGWYDDVSDGPVTASIQFHGSGDTPPVEGAWVIVAPPKFAPHQDSIITLYDRLLQKMIEDFPQVLAPATTSYSNDVYPILQRAAAIAWVEGLPSNHAWTHPVTNQSAVDAIFDRISTPSGGGGNMPVLLNGPDITTGQQDDELTPTQYDHLQRWKNGTYTNDWVGPPPEQPIVTPDGMDRAALEACVGGAFLPGIEAGGKSVGDRPILEHAYSAPFRIDHTASGPGDISASMALPWQADFYACKDNWWPIPRPNDVRTTPGGSFVEWERGVGSMAEMVDKWADLAFVVRQGTEHIESERCDTTSITLLTPHLDFVDVPQGPMGGVREVPLAIVFEVVSTGGAVTLEYAPGGAPAHPQLVAYNTTTTVGPTTGSGTATAYLWVIYRTDSIGSVLPTQTVTVREPASGRTWQVTIDGNSVARATTAVAFALDRSGSMSDDRGDGETKHRSLQEAANLFVDLMLQGDGVGLARFNENAQPVEPVLELGDGMLSDTKRGQIHDAIDGNELDPGGATSIGDGIYEARQLLAGVSSYDHEALVVLTDGIENRERWISDVSDEIDETTYAIGFGKPQNISVAALQTISGNNGGYLLVTGAIGQDNRFRLQKHFLQILAGVNNAEVVLDPDGSLRRGQTVRVPFTVSDADSGVEVILLTPWPQVVDFRIEGPLGEVITPWRAVAEPTMHFAFSDGAAFYRLALPVLVEPGRFDHQGTWHAVLRIGKPQVERPDHDDRDRDVVAGHSSVAFPRLTAERRLELAREAQSGLASIATLARGSAAASAATHDRDRRSLPYAIVVHAYSTVAFRADADQDGYAPGATVRLRGLVTQSGIADHDAAVWGDVTTPSGSSFRVDLQPGAEDHTGSFVASSPGVYEVRLRARGTTRAGLAFTRERLVTAAAWRGGDRPDDPAGNPHEPSGGAAGDHWCELIDCLVESGTVPKELLERLRAAGIDVGRLRKCLCGRSDDRTPR